MNATNILFATDFSPANDAALGFASSLASEANATLHIVHVTRPVVDPLAAGPYGYVVESESPTAVAATDHRKLSDMVPTVDSVDCQRHERTGDAATEVLSTAEQVGADLIVVGSHGRTGLTRALMGSVAEAIVRRAACPVLVVKNPPKANSD